MHVLTGTHVNSFLFVKRHKTLVFNTIYSYVHYTYMMCMTWIAYQARNFSIFDIQLYK